MSNKFKSFLIGWINYALMNVFVCAWNMVSDTSNFHVVEVRWLLGLYLKWKTSDLTAAYWRGWPNYVCTNLDEVSRNIIRLPEFVHRWLGQIFSTRIGLPSFWSQDENRSSFRNVVFFSVMLKHGLSFLWCCDPTRVMTPSFLRFLDHIQERTTVVRTPLD
jgi:hypothetical protein